MDGNLNDYTAVGDKYEYYRYHGLYVDSASAGSRYIEMLQTSNQATLKLPETTSKEEMSKIADQVVNGINRSIEYHWLNGVLTVIAL